MPVQEEQIGALRVLTLNDPPKRNAVGAEMRRELRAALLRAEADPGCRALVLAGAGDHFCSGGDVSSMSAVTELTGGRERVRDSHELVHALVGIAKPIVAAVEGWAAGGGMALALLCDTVVAAEGAKFIASHVKIGLVADFGLIHTLRQRVGAARARQILLYGDAVTAQDALAMGLVDHLAPTGTALHLAITKAQTLAAAAPLSIGYMKQFLTRGLQDALDWERDTLAALYLTADQAEGRSAFLEKRKAQFVGR
jgi:enoyl-CoA hydratase/carnithine racemase